MGYRNRQDRYCRAGRRDSRIHPQDSCREVRLSSEFGSEVAGATRVLYGGSMNVGNVVDLLAQPDIDGGLIGGAALKAADFIEIAKSF